MIISLSSLSSLGYKESAGSSIDADAQAFLIAAAIVDVTIVGAIDTLVRTLKTAGVWAKLHALWPMVGGSASTHKWNLKDPRDLDAAYRLSFLGGGWTHSSTGALPNGSSSYANTFLVPTTVLTPSNGSLGVYSRTDSTAGQPYDLAASSASDTQATFVICRYTNSNAYLNYGTSTYVFSASPDGRGFFVTNRLSATQTDQVRNGSHMSSSPITENVSLPAFSFYLGCNNRGGTPAYFSNKQYALAFVGNGMSLVEIAAFYAAVQAFQTTLGRSV